MENSEPYKVATIKLKQINRVKTDHKFRKIIKLSRFVNHVRFCQRTMVANRDDFYRDLATAKRDVNAAIVLGAGSFFELLKTLKSMESNFKQFENPKKKIRDLLNKPETEDLCKRLKTIRNRVAFHFDDDAIDYALSELQDDSFDYFVQETKQVGDACFVFADRVSAKAMMFEVNDKKEQFEPDDKREQMESLTYGDLLDRIIRIQESVLELCNELIVKYSKSIGAVEVTV